MIRPELCLQKQTIVSWWGGVLIETWCGLILIEGSPRYAGNHPEDPPHTCTACEELRK